MSNILAAASLGVINGGVLLALIALYATPLTSNRRRNRYRNAHGQRAAIERYVSDLRRNA